MVDLLDAAQHALDLVGTDPRLALAEADAVVGRLPNPRSPDEVRALCMAQRAAGLSLRSIGDPVQAERRMRRGLAVAERRGELEPAAEVRMSLAFVLLDLGRTRAALSMTDHALAVLRGVKAARARTIRALVLQRSQRIREAFAEYDAALPVLRRAKDTAWEARLRHNRALLLVELGETAPAIVDLDWVRAHDLEHGHLTDAADALFNMGIARTMAGDIPEALAIFDQAELEWDGVPRPEIRMARAEALLFVGLTSEAARQAEAAADWLHERHWGRLEVQARLTLAVCLLASAEADPVGARAQAVRARGLMGADDRTEWEPLALYVITKSDLMTGATPRSLDRASQIAATLRDMGSEAPAADLRITAARAALARGDVGRGRTLLGPLVGHDRSPDRDVAGRACFARALLAEADGDLRRAAADLRRAWALVEKQRDLLGATELRAAAASHAEALVATGARLAVRSGSATAAFTWAELGRAAVLRYQPASAPSDPELARALARLRWQATDSDSGLGAVSDPAADRVVARSEAEVLRVTRRLRGARSGLAPVGVRDVEGRLAGRRYVHFLGVGSDLAAVVIGAGRPRLVDLGPAGPVLAAIDTVTFGLRRSLAGFGTASGGPAAAAGGHRAARVLDAALLRPLAPFLADAALVVCPTASLTAVPWSLLASTRGRTVHIAPSATVWCRAADVVAPRARVTLAVAGPGLAGADREVAEVARLHPGTRSLTGPHATVAAVLDAAPSSDVLHLAAHGHLRRDNPLFSSLDLADGPLTGYHLESLPRVPSTVVLSACSSGAGHATVAEETLGLAWTLMGLGAAQVIAPLLPVPDHSTHDLMVGVHRRLAAGARAADALAAEQADTDPEDPARGAVAGAFVAYGA